jgi:ATP-dependent exoDNAse (exonuclease V) beta subunit
MADLIFNIVRRYHYETLKRIDTDNGRRYVNRFDEALPSVTTILDFTKDKTKLDEWKQRVGDEEAERIRISAAAVGTAMHSFIEGHIKNRPIRPAKNWNHLKGFRMGSSLMETYFEHLEEVWGNEVMVFKRGKYAGTTDLVGVYKGKPSIVDFKQTNKMKKREWVDDYFMQLAAYAGAHNDQHGTNIRDGVILMASQTGECQEFIITGREFDHYLDLWRAKVDDFLSHSKQSPEEIALQIASMSPHPEEQASLELSQPVELVEDGVAEQDHQDPETRKDC